ncbi:MAG: MerR family transcriptional regulator [Capsulimonadaceae bacterium]|nr:MerR family transcriptional regulator [Capsulimonadaceae bacterium]
MSTSTLEVLTIQQMALLSGLSEHTLRYYERIGLIEPIPRHESSGHRRYSADTVRIIEGLSCLRKTGLSIEDMRRFIELRKYGAPAAAEQRKLFMEHRDRIDREIEDLKIRRNYLDGKVAYWDAIQAGDDERARRIGQQNAELAKKLK